MKFTFFFLRTIRALDKKILLEISLEKNQNVISCVMYASMKKNFLKY